MKAKAEAARDRFEEGKKQLFRSDGEKLYADSEHEERLRSLRAERNAALDQVEAEAQEAFEAATEELSNLENGGPAVLLSGEDLEQAGARLPQEEARGRLSLARRGLRGQGGRVPGAPRAEQLLRSELKRPRQIIPSD